MERCYVAGTGLGIYIHYNTFNHAARQILLCRKILKIQDIKVLV